MFLEKENLLSKQKDVGSTFNKHFGLQTPQIFICPEDTSTSSGNDTINSIIENLPFTEV